MLQHLSKIKSKKGLIVLVLVAVLGWAGVNVSENDVSKVVNTFMTEDGAVQTTPQKSSAAANVKEDFNSASNISDQRRVHILYGDATGGGHLYGTGKPCKSEFPKHWDEQTVIKEVSLIAANDNLNWQQQRNGYYVTEQKVGTVNVRVVKGRNNQDVITAYPTNTGRNPCPKPANDN